MENIYLLIIVGFVIGALGTLIGAGGGFILVPLLIIMRPDFTPETILQFQWWWLPAMLFQVL